MKQKVENKQQEIRIKYGSKTHNKNKANPYNSRMQGMLDGANQQAPLASLQPPGNASSANPSFVSTDISVTVNQTNRKLVPSQEFG